MNAIDSSVIADKTAPRSKMPLLVMAVILLPMVVAYIIFHTGWGFPTTTTNKGTLLTPAISVQDFDVDGTTPLAFMSDVGNKRWRLLVPVPSSCDSACQKNMYTTRQVHVRLAEKAYRVERVFALFEAPSVKQQQNFASQHPNARLVTVPPILFSQWLGTDAIARDNVDQHYYLVDQEGFVMMSYTANHSGQDLLDDIKKLLKFTYDN